MAMHGKAKEKRIRMMSELIPFIQHGAAMSAYDGDSYPGMGRMPDYFQDQLRSSNPTYVIYSYRTPICWVCGDGKVCMPNVKYSATTTGHQAACRQAYEYNVVMLEEK